MGTRRRDAERRQVSLAVEALEDRFLLSGAASLSTPAATNEHSALFPAAHNHAEKNQTRSPSAQATLVQDSAWETSATVSKNAPSAHPAPLTMNALVKPMMDYQQDEDGSDDDSLDRTDGDASRNVPVVLPPSAYACDDAMPSLDCSFLSRSPEQTLLPAANLLAFLPLLSATGLGAAKITPLSPATSISEYALGNSDPVPAKEEMRPLPAVPQAPPTPPSPQVAEPAEPRPLSARGPLAELLPIDAEAIQQGVDAFFKELGDLAEEWREGRVLEALAPWLLAASLAGYGWIRLRAQRDRHLADLLGAGQPGSASSFLPGAEG
jgi:hypothetical protein